MSLKTYIQIGLAWFFFGVVTSQLFTTIGVSPRLVTLGAALLSLGLLPWFMATGRRGE